MNASQPDLPSSMCTERKHDSTPVAAVIEVRMAPTSVALHHRSDRCREKGCIFPVSAAGGGSCAYHQLEQDEPKHFLSLQPSQFVLTRAKFGLPDPDYDDSRFRDRRRLLWHRETLREDAA